MSGGRDTKRVVRLSCSFHPVQTSPLDTCVCRRHRYRRQAPLELRNCRCPAAYLDDRPPPPPQLSETSWQLASKGRLVILRNAFENLCRTDTSRSPTCEGKHDRLEFSPAIDKPRFASNKFSRSTLVSPFQSRFFFRS